MHYFDPSRPQVAHKPAYVSTHGAAIAPLPQVNIVPQGGTQLRLSLFLMDGPNLAKVYSTLIPTSQFEIFWHEWLEDPEGVMREMFGYSYNPQPSSHPRPIAITLTLKDLGLD